MINHTTDPKSVRSRHPLGLYFDILAVCLSPPVNICLNSPQFTQSQTPYPKSSANAILNSRAGPVLLHLMQTSGVLPSALVSSVGRMLRSSASRRRSAAACRRAAFAAPAMRARCRCCASGAAAFAALHPVAHSAAGPRQNPHTSAPARRVLTLAIEARAAAFCAAVLVDLPPMPAATGQVPGGQ